MRTLRKAPDVSPLFPELSVVEVLSAIGTDDGAEVSAGSRGTIVAERSDGAAYEVEFARPVVGNATVRVALLSLASSNTDRIRLFKA